MRTTTKTTRASTSGGGVAAVAPPGDDHLAVQSRPDALADPLTDPLQQAADPAVAAPDVAAPAREESAGDDGADAAAQKERQEYFQLLLKLHTKLHRYEDLARDQMMSHGATARAGGASSGASEDYETEYRKLLADVQITKTRCVRTILEVSDGRGNVLESMHPGFVRQRYSDILAKVVSIEVDMEMNRTSGRHGIEVSNAEDAIAAAQQMRGILKKSSVMLFKVGMMGLGVPPETAERISKGYAVFLDTLDVAVGDRWILQGKETSPEEMEAIFTAQLMKLAVDECHGKLMGNFLEHEVTQKICDSLGANMFADVVKGMIDLAFVKWGPTLTPSPDNILKGLKQSMAAKAQDMQDRASFDLSNQGFVNWLTDTSIDTMDLALTTVAKRKFGG